MTIKNIDGLLDSIEFERTQYGGDSVKWTPEFKAEMRGILNSGTVTQQIAAAASALAHFETENWHTK